MNFSKAIAAALMFVGASAAHAADNPQTAPDSLPRADTGDIETHADGSAANSDALQLARSDKAAFVGKELMFSNGQDVGKIKDVRRWTRDMELYMIVAAEPFFNEAVDYAVPVGEVTRVLDDHVELPESPGMHLRGMEYYPEDFENINAGKEIPLIVDE